MSQGWQDVLPPALMYRPAPLALVEVGGRQQVLMARIPVSGVRTSCANAASAASTIPGQQSRRRACCAPCPRQRLERFFKRPPFDGRLMRSERDFGA